MPGNYHYCFVDMASPEEAQRAMTGLNGQEIPSGILKVSMAKPPRARESDGAYSPRRTGEDENGGRPREKAPQQPMRSLMSNNWRSKAT
jgi:RNA recognition motif-containing protein